MKKQLIFVYNANSSVFSVVSDYVHKIVFPKTYNCNLCKITYGNLGMKKEWKSFIKTLHPQPAFLHKNELHKKYPTVRNIPLPAIFEKNGNEVKRIISNKQINSAKTINELIELIKNVAHSD